MYLNYGGSRKTISSAYGNISGTRKQIYPYSATTTYTYSWKRYSLVGAGYKAYEYDIVYDDGTDLSGYIESQTNGSTVIYGSSYRISGTTISLRSTTTVSIDDFLDMSRINGYQSGGYMFAYHNGQYMGGQSSRTMSNSTYSSNNEYLYKFAFKDYTVYEEEYINFRVKYSAGSKGSYIDTVTSTDINQYPEEGSDGSYWYEYQGQV